MSLTNRRLPVRILYVTIKLKKAQISPQEGKRSWKRASRWLFMNHTAGMTNTTGLILLFSRLIIFSLKVFHLHRKNWAGGMSGKKWLLKPLKNAKNWVWVLSPSFCVKQHNGQFISADWGKETKTIGHGAFVFLWQPSDVKRQWNKCSMKGLFLTYYKQMGPDSGLWCNVKHTDSPSKYRCGILTGAIHAIWT